jgi:isopentenyl-diphosphate Delta-isomerase
MEESCDNRAAATVGAADAESLILVDEADRGVGHLSKLRCHEGHGILHRAFSVFIFNAGGELLIQQRSASKRLWPLYWSNSCCSHPRIHETLERATARRLLEELGLACPLRFLYKFQYQAQFDATGAEHELCSVFVGESSHSIEVNRDEIQAVRWVGPEALDAEMTGCDAGRFTPWFKLEWARIRSDHRAEMPGLQ